MLNCTTSTVSSSSVVQVGNMVNFCTNEKHNVQKLYALIWLRVTIFKLGTVLLLFCNFEWFNIKLPMQVFLLSKKKLRSC